MRKKVDPMVIDAVERFALEARKSQPSCAVYLFGSHAKGCPRPGSDIDVAVVVPEIRGSAEDPWAFMNASDELWRIASEIDDSIEPCLIETRHDRSGFLSTIVSTGLRVA